MKRLSANTFAVVALALAGASAALSSCGDSGRPERAADTTPRHRSSQQPFLGDGDFDHGDGDPDNSWDTDSDAPFDYYNRRNESWNRGVFHDRDDSEELAFGRPAGMAEAHALSLIVRRYYSLAAKDDGQRACAMLAPRAARTMATYSQNGLPYLRRVKTCPEALRLVFRRTRLSVPRVTSVRVDGDTAIVLWGSRTMPAGYMTLVRNADTWTIAAPVGNPLL